MCHQKLIRTTDTHSFTPHMLYPVARKPRHPHKPSNPSKRHGRYLEKRNWLFLCHACIDIFCHDTTKYVQNNKYAQKRNWLDPPIICSRRVVRCCPKCGGREKILGCLSPIRLFVQKRKEKGDNNNYAPCSQLILWCL